MLDRCLGQRKKQRGNDIEMAVDCEMYARVEVGRVVRFTHTS